MRSPSDTASSGGKLFRIYSSGKYLSIKHSSYFHVYERLFSPYVGKEIVFVEIGVLNGGSLFMWREYFGSRARIIGVDMNPEALKWKEHGFEIHIGDQSSALFWEELFRNVGPVDIVLDDGGHTNVQQISTLRSTLDHIKDGGLLVIEDAHCSYFREFGNPYRYSFMEYAKRLVDHVNGRFPQVRAPRNSLGDKISCITFFESIVAIEVDRRLCSVPVPTSNGGISSDARDFRYSKSKTVRLVAAVDYRLKAVPLLRHLRPYLSHLLWLRARLEGLRVRDLFR